MNRRNQLGTAFIVLAVVLFTLPALFPVQAVLTHDTGPVTFDNREQLQEQGISIIAYENMTERGQELYVQTLEAGGEYRVPVGEGASDFEYLTGKERMQVYEDNTNQRPGIIVVERPEDSDLPEADEPFSEGPRNTDRPEDEQRRQQVQRYDMMQTSTGPPPLAAISQLLRLAAGLLAVLSLGVGGYLLSSH
jgi:hypothetical protein